MLLQKLTYRFHYGTLLIAIAVCAFGIGVDRFKVRGWHASNFTTSPPTSQRRKDLERLAGCDFEFKVVCWLPGT